MNRCLSSRHPIEAARPIHPPDAGATHPPASQDTLIALPTAVALAPAPADCGLGRLTPGTPAGLLVPAPYPGAVPRHNPAASPMAATTAH